MLTLDQIKQRIEQLADQIHAPAHIMPTYGFLRRDGTPNIEVDNLSYYYVNYDRNIKVFDRKTSDLDVLLYWVFEDITFTMASDYLRANCGATVDSRKVRFEHQLSLLQVIHHDWKERKEKEIVEILKNSP